VLLAGHQPQYLPYPGFFHKIAAADLFIVVDHIQYKKKEWQNRNRIRTNDGWMWLTVPVITSGRYYQPIYEVQLRQDTRWQDKHWKSLLMNYRKAPFFNDYRSKIEQIYQQPWEHLIDLNMAFITYFMEVLHIDTPLVMSSDYNFEQNKTELLIEMCQALGADGYLSGTGGKDYVDETLFDQAGLIHQYQDFHCPGYSQIHSRESQDFIPDLSVVDMLFNAGDESGLLLKSV